MIRAHHNAGVHSYKHKHLVSSRMFQKCDKKDTTARGIHMYKASKFFRDPGPEAMPGVMKEADAAVQRSQDRIKQNTETIII